MKHTLSLIWLTFTISISYAQTSDVEHFWDSIKMNNRELNSYKKNKSALKNKSLDEFLQVKKSSAQFFNSITNGNVEIANRLSQKIIGDKSFRTIIFFDDEYRPNAGIDPNGNLTVGVTLFAMLDENEFLGIMAHEAAHLMLKHHEIARMNYMKEARNAKVMSAIVSGLYAAAVMYGEYSSAANTGNYSAKRLYGIIPTSIAISESFIRNIEFQDKLYSRRQEIEADFAAAAFLDHVGIGREVLISALTKVRDYYTELGYNTTKMVVNETHPSLDDRMEYLHKYKNANFDDASFMLY